jgi:type III pantothenate kinase
MQSYSAVAFCEIGNSSIKLCVQQRFLTIEYRRNHRWGSTVVRVLRTLPEPLLLVIASVAPERSRTLLRLLARQLPRCSVCWANELLPPNNPLLPYPKVHGIGIDRLLALLGARRELAPPLIALDCGTAVTVNALDATGECRGGAILPGISLQLRALARGTAALPRLEFALPQHPIGSTTAEAMRSGVYAAVLGGILELLRRYRESLQAATLPVAITGGTAHLLYPELSARWDGAVVLRPHLVLEGLQWLWESTPGHVQMQHVQPVQVHQ